MNLIFYNSFANFTNLFILIQYFLFQLNWVHQWYASISTSSHYDFISNGSVELEFHCDHSPFVDALNSWNFILLTWIYMSIIENEFYVNIKEWCVKCYVCGLNHITFITKV